MSVGSKGAGADQFDGPLGVAITEDDRVLVADSFNHRIQVLIMEGQFLASVRTKGNAPLQFEFPALAIDDKDYVYISELELQRISIFTTTGKFIHCLQRCDEDSDGKVAFNTKLHVWALAVEKSRNM